MSKREIESGALWRRYVLALSAVAAFLVASHVTSVLSTRGSQETAAAINISGRQRMLSQRIVGLLARENAEPQSEGLTEALDQAIALFDESHRGLVEGGAADLTASGAARRASIYLTDEGAGTLDAQVRSFILELGVARGRIEGDREAAFRRLTSLSVTDPLLRALDSAVQDIEAQAVSNIQRMRRISQMSLLAALLVLLIEARFIFWPAQRAVRRSFQELVEHRDALAASEKDLRAALDRADEAQQEINRMLNARTSFFAGMSADLRTPIKILRGYVDQIIQLDLPSPANRQLSLVQHAAEQMETIIDDVLDVRRIEEGLMEINEEPVELEAFTHEIADRYRARAERKGLLLLVQSDRALPDWMEMDPRRVGQILDNLLSNAVKFTFHGQITVKLALAKDDQWTLEVVDTGEGLSLEDQQKLFQKFEEKPGEPGRCEGGTGLGLPICHDLAALMGGTIAVHSVVGEGSAFKITLPLKPAEAPAGQERKVSASAAA